MLYDIIRFSTQHRALHCYVLLSIWIFLLIAGLYKFLEPSQHVTVFNLPHTESMQGYRSSIKTRRIFKSCNKVDDFVTGSEGLLTLQKRTFNICICVVHVVR